ncbi:MAG: RlpA-like double-psi beta-barrel domain-containing protein [Pseudomonadota bacterium]
MALTLGSVAAALVAIPLAEAKRPGSTYCFVGKCHRVKTLGEMQRLVGKDITLHASHYDHCKKDRYNPCGLTSSGTPFKPQRPDNAASPIYPDGTRLLVWNPVTRAAALIRIDNAGPYWGNRKLDVSRATADKLGFSKQGVAALKTRVISAPNSSESRYVRNRKYEPVAGFLGKFESLDDAEYALAAVMAVRAMAASSLAPVSAAVVARSHAEPVIAEKQRRKLAKKAATIIARLDDEKPPVPSTQVASKAVAEKTARMAALDVRAVPRRKARPTKVARFTPPIPELSPQHRSRRLAGLQPLSPPVTVTLPPVRVAKIDTPPVPELSPQHRSRRLAGLSPPLPDLGPARWRIAAAKLPPPPGAKPTRVASARSAEDLDDLAWTLEQVLIERHFRQTRESAIISIDDAPFGFRVDRPLGDRLRLPVYEARAGRMG